jgi:hypothetical protein
MKSSLTVTTYREFHEYVDAFAIGRIPLLMVIGDPGTSKSQSMKRALSKRKAKPCWIEGQASAVAMYAMLYEHRHKIVVIDDVDQLYKDDASRRLLKSLCKTEKDKRLSWNTRSSYLEGEGVPNSFSTKSRVCIIANEWHTLNSDVAAIEDRAVGLLFKPTPLEVHLEVKKWFKDKIAYEFMASILHLVQNPSMRHYLFASNLRNSKIRDWKSRTIERVCSKELVRIAQIEAEYETIDERIAAFERAGLGSRAKYYRIRKKLPKPVEVPVSKSHRFPKLARA